MQALLTQRRVRRHLRFWTDLAFQPRASHPSKAVGAWGYVAMAVIGFLASYLRFPPRWRDTLWAEDGAIFLEQAFRLPFGSALLMPYAGYTHVLPRVAAEFSTHVPVLVVPQVTAVLMSAVTSGLGLTVFHFAGAHLRARAARILLWLLYVAAPIAGMEIALSTANLQWFLLAATLLAVMGRRGGWGSTIVACIVVLASFTSSLLALMFIPFLVWRAVMYRSAGDGVLLGVGAAGAAIQLSGAAGGVRELVDAQNAPIEWLQFFAVGAVESGWIGPAATSVLVSTSDVVATVLGLFLLLATVFVAFWIRRWSALPLVAFVLAMGYLAFVNAVTHAAGGGAEHLFEQLVNSRYLFFPVFVVGVVVVAFADRLLSRDRSSTRTAFGALLLLVQLAAVITSYAAFDVRAVQLAGSPPWSESVAAARAQCEAGAGDVYLRGDVSSHFDWDTIVVPCSYVLSDRARSAGEGYLGG